VALADTVHSIITTIEAHKASRELSLAALRERVAGRVADRIKPGPGDTLSPFTGAYLAMPEFPTRAELMHKPHDLNPQYIKGQYPSMDLCKALLHVCPLPGKPSVLVIVVPRHSSHVQASCDCVPILFPPPPPLPPSQISKPCIFSCVRKLLDHCAKG
jgi:hypothetical protein